MFEDVAAAWEATWLDLEPKTQAGYKAILKRHVLRRWRGVRIGAVTPEAIQDWLNELACERHANTVRRIYSVLRAVMKVAVERRYLLANPCDAVRGLDFPLDRPNDLLELRITASQALAEWALKRSNT